MLAFVHIEKCAGTPLERAFRRYFSLDHINIIPRDPDAVLASSGDLRHVLRLRPSVRSLAGHSLRVHCGFEEVVPEIAYVTLLRDPVNRYLSEYRQFVDIVHCPADFQAWLDRKDRHNFQTRAIAGVDDPDAAIEVLNTKFQLVGTAEKYDTFFRQLARLIRCEVADLSYKVVNRSTDRRRCTPLPDLSKYRDQILYSNRHDLRVYQHVDEVLIPRMETSNYQGFELQPFQSLAPRSQIMGVVRQAGNRIFRNLIYKPSLGLWPVPHALKPYRAA